MYHLYYDNFPLNVMPGKPYPLGATWDGLGVNFAIYSAEAEKVELCLFVSADHEREYVRIPLTERTNRVFHCYISDIFPGQLYGYRVHGPFSAAEGFLFNPNKLLFDPYARAVGRDMTWHESLYTLNPDGSVNLQDSAAWAPLAAVIDDSFCWDGDRRPEIPWSKTIIYEAHLKGFTRRHPSIPEYLQGTYLGFASDPVINYLKKLGITTVELLPVHYSVSEHELVRHGLKNFWGYNTLGYFAPQPDYTFGHRSSDAVQDFKVMVKKLHAAGIEVILDVVYNHTAETDHNGPTLSFRGIDNRAYYRLDPEDQGKYIDYTGCGNSLNMQNPYVLRMIMDSLRYWITEMHVDGFRFDLASTLARELHSVDKLGAFFDIITQDPVISQVKLIAEPWDLGEGGFQVGNFPNGWTEWNGLYRDCMRRFWLKDLNRVDEFATRLGGSSDLYEKDSRSPFASINFITCHDGFTLHDLVSYDKKHNDNNPWNNTDGEEHNNSNNHGTEGDSDDPAVISLRNKQKKNLIACLFLSQGVPMLLAGDEFNRSLGGNNNAYCHDSELNYIRWTAKDEDELLDFIRELIELRKANRVLGRKNFFRGRSIEGLEIKDIAWYHKSGREMTVDDWKSPGKSLGVFMAEPGQGGLDNQLFVIFNGEFEPVSFRLPRELPCQTWYRLLCTDSAFTRLKFQAGKKVNLPEKTVLILRPDRRYDHRRLPGSEPWTY